MHNKRLDIHASPKNAQQQRAEGNALHPDVEALRNRMCGYSTACVSDAIIAYFKLPDCSQATRREIFNYLSENTPAQEGGSLS